MDPKRLLESRDELVGLAGDVDLQPTELAQLPPPPTVEVSRLRRGLGAVDVFPARAELENGRLDTLDQAELTLQRPSEPSGFRQSVEIHVIDVNVGDGAGEVIGNRVRLVRRDEKVRERGVPTPEEAAHGQAKV